MKNSNAETLYHILDGNAEALEFAIREESAVTYIPLAELKEAGYINEDILSLDLYQGQHLLSFIDTGLNKTVHDLFLAIFCINI